MVKLDERFFAFYQNCYTAEASMLGLSPTDIPKSFKIGEFEFQYQYQETDGHATEIKGWKYRCRSKPELEALIVND